MIEGGVSSPLSVETEPLRFSAAALSLLRRNIKPKFKEFGMRLDHPLVGTGDAAFAADIAYPMLALWIDRRQLPLSPTTDRAASGQGTTNLLSLRRTYQVGITAALHRRGIPVRLAAAVARRFSDEGSEGRGPGELYESGSTWLLADGPLIDSARVVNAAPAPSSVVAIAIDVGAIVATVRARLASRGVDLAA